MSHTEGGRLRRNGRSRRIQTAASRRTKVRGAGRRRGGQVRGRRAGTRAGSYARAGRGGRAGTKRARWHERGRVGARGTSANTVFRERGGRPVLPPSPPH